MYKLYQSTRDLLGYTYKEPIDLTGLAHWPFWDPNNIYIILDMDRHYFIVDHFYLYYTIFYVKEHYKILISYFEFYFILDYIPEIFFILGVFFLLIFYVYFNERVIKKKYFIKNINSFFFLLIILNFLTIILLLDILFTDLSNLCFFGEDSLTTFIKSFILILYLVLLLFTFLYYKNINFENFESIYLLTTSILGLIFLLNSYSLITMYLSIEIFNLSVYIIIALRKNRKVGIESGLKFFIVGSISSALLLHVFAILYYITGTLQIHTLEVYFFDSKSSAFFLIYSIIVLTIVFALKMVFAPFHQWAVDVYDGAPLFITFYLALIPKIVYCIIFVKLYYTIFNEYLSMWKLLFVLLILCSTFIGIFGAIQQLKIKKFIVFSMIANSGFLLIPFLLLESKIDALSLLIYFSIIYSFNLIGLFFLLILLFDYSNKNFIKHFKDLINLENKNKLLSILFLIFLGSLAGLPPFAGFFPKIYLLILLYSNDYINLCFILIILNSIGIFYYIRILKLIFFNKNKNFFIFIKPLKEKFSYIYWILSFISILNIFFFFFSNDLLLFVRELIMFYLIIF